MSECVNVANVRFVAADTDSEQYSPRYMCMWMAHECKIQYNTIQYKEGICRHNVDSAHSHPRR